MTLRWRVMMIWLWDKVKIIKELEMNKDKKNKESMSGDI